MDQSLVEKITKLVLSKLAEHSDVSPLTSTEINEWNNLNLFSSPKATVKDCQSNFSPLSDSELRAWNEISFSIKKANSTLTNRETLEERVKFLKYN